ncbi:MULTISPECIES: TetR/AcrR family transcriptional regulator [Rhodocyclales]|uniref:TetR family transcriptional regulator n=2 Tax=Aromatoleum TaxID=551759 RepID=A0ABX1MIY7_9RHOO|nr:MULTISPECIES: TetR/AcrR family transcriptional regulator [Rhodocyclales]AKU12442.1 protein DitK [Azoarcus sp. CIB]NMF87100.1 TetR family transcriptional regulator [Aromatoleum petrolei]NMG42221.1 TetR family transcriptional regulator [Aromatoleum toluvorans]
MAEAVEAGKAKVKKPRATASAKEGAEPAPVKAVKAVRRNRRSESTILGIFDATEAVVLESGADRVNILDVCETAGISRGTFYRYFSSQDDLLDAFSRHRRDRFHAALIEATAPYTDPDERFDAVLRFVDDYLERGNARRLLVVAPEYAMRWLQRIFPDSVIRFQDVLGPVFDAWESRAGIKIDRELTCELLVRYILSEILVPAGPERRSLPRRLERMFAMLMQGRVSRR